MILAIDSSGRTGVAVVDGDEVVFSVVDERTRAHAEAIGPMLAGAATAAGSNIEAVAYGTGPGPFTGLRVGMAAARMFAVGRGVPAIPVISHDAIALAHVDAGGPVPFLVVTDARRREVYWTAYGRVDERGLPIASAPPAVGQETGLPDLPHAESVVAPDAIARVAALGGGTDDPAPRYLRAPDVTPPKARP